MVMLSPLRQAVTSVHAGDCPVIYGCGGTEWHEWVLLLAEVIDHCNHDGLFQVGYLFPLGYFITDDIDRLIPMIVRCLVGVSKWMNPSQWLVGMTVLKAFAAIGDVGGS